MNIFTLLISGFIYYFLDYINARVDNKEMDINLLSNLCFSFFTLTGHCYNSPNYFSTQIFIFSLALFCLVLSSSYTVNLASFLVVNKKELKINQIQDAVNAKLCFYV